MLKPILLEDVCAKQEHLIAMTKIKHFTQTQAVFQVEILLGACNFYRGVELGPSKEAGLRPVGVGSGPIIPGLPTEAS